MSSPPHSYLEYLAFKIFAGYMRLSMKIIARSQPLSPTSTLEIPSREPGRAIKINIYASEKHQTPSPVLINWHGSGFIVPSLGSDDNFCRQMARSTGYTVLDADYRKAPEHLFPAALEDAEDVILYVLARPELYDVSRLAVSGFSAGGALALALATNPNSRVPPDAVKTLIALYPSCNYTIPRKDMKDTDGGSGSIPPFFLRTVYACYLPRGTDRTDPRISPSFAKLESFPSNMLFVTCGKDSLAPDAEKLAKKLQGMPGKNIVLKRIEGVDHGWDKTQKEGSEQAMKRDEAYKYAADMLR